MTAPGTFSNKTTAAGHHLVLTGDNGEKVVVSENHPNARGSKESLEVIVRTVLAAVLRDKGDSDLIDSEYFDGYAARVTNQLWDQS